MFNHLLSAELTLTPGLPLERGAPWPRHGWRQWYHSQSCRLGWKGGPSLEMNQVQGNWYLHTYIYICIYTDILKIVEVVLVLRVCKYVSIYCVDVTYVSDYMCWRMPRVACLSWVALAQKFEMWLHVHWACSGVKVHCLFNSKGHELTNISLFLAALKLQANNSNYSINSDLKQHNLITHQVVTELEKYINALNNKLQAILDMMETLQDKRNPPPVERYQLSLPNHWFFSPNRIWSHRDIPSCSLIPETIF